MKDNITYYLNGRISLSPDLCNGRPTIRGKRITVQTILEFLSAGDSKEEILQQYPSLESDDIDACLQFAAKDTDYIHVKEINDEWTDSQIWDYAQKNRLTIVTKDTDFSDLMMMHEPPPRVIHIKIGNVRMRELHNVVTKLWFDVKNLSKTRKLVRMYSDKIEGIK